MIYLTNIGSGERPEGIITNILCKCGCREYIIHSFNRIARGEKPPLYKWGHFGIISLKEFRWKKGAKPWNEGKCYSCDKISKAKKGKHLPGMFEKGHETNVGKKYKKRSKKLAKKET